MPEIRPAISTVSTPAPARPEQLSVNIFDLDRIESSIRQMLLGGKLDLSKALTIGERPDDRAVGFCCDLLSAACLCDIMRSNDRKFGDSPTRIYMRSRLNLPWFKIDANIVLTGLGEDEAIHLNPQIFPPLTTANEVPLSPMPLF